MARSIRRVLHLLVCALVVFALTPGARDVLDAAAHLVHDGHLPHAAAHDPLAAEADCPTSCEEDGCTPLCHHCSCCVSQPGDLGRAGTDVSERFADAHAQIRVRDERHPRDFGVKPPLFPPIA